MKIYCMSDIHGYIREMENALNMFQSDLENENTILLLLGDYIHGPHTKAVLNKILFLQKKYGKDKVIPLLGNHEEMALDGRWALDMPDIDDHTRDQYLSWIYSMQRYYICDKTIFVHAGIDEEAKELWEWGTDEYTFTEKYPAQLGHFYKDYRIVAGHIGTSEICGDKDYHDIYYDGQSHYYIDGTVKESGRIPVLMVDTDTDKYYRVTESGKWIVLPYSEEN